MKALTEIIQGLPVKSTINLSEIMINKLVFDSRKVAENDMFFAVNGVAVDGHNFIEKAIQFGAKVIVCESIPENINPNICYLQVENSSVALGKIAAKYYQNPTQKLKLVGITGTNGKTTTTTLLHSLFTNLGYQCALISTVENKIGNKTIKSTHTTPDAITLNELLNEAVQKGCEYAFMEVSSHGIHQNRLSGLQFAVAGFTNITHDHLDYHGTFAEYIKAKKRFFDELNSEAEAITNIDDKNGLIMLQNTKAHKHNYSLKSSSEYKIKILESRLDGMLLRINNSEFWTSLVGEFNAYNLLLVFAVAHLLGKDENEILLQLSATQKVKGRFETYQSNKGINIIIDYAHTPDALENTLSAIKKIRTNNETLFTVFGCGGNRDKDKRPVMAKIACELSDKVIITSDNPRNEEPETIIKEIQQGVPAQFYNKTISISDRKEAIKNALMQAKPNDIVLIAGKGHENYQEIKGVKYHFDDKETAFELLKLLEL